MSHSAGSWASRAVVGPWLQSVVLAVRVAGDGQVQEDGWVINSQESVFGAEQARPTCFVRSAGPR